MPGKDIQDYLINRYKNAFIMARVNISIGVIVKLIGIIGGLIFCVWTITKNSDIYYTIYAALIGGVVYLIGITICSFGEMNRAVIDIAVNTSPFVSNEIKEQILFSKSEDSKKNEILAEYECSDCKHTISEKDIFCPNCGIKL